MKVIPKDIKPLNLKNGTKALADLKFRDKLLRLIQYLSKFLAYTLLQGDAKSDLGGRIKLLASGIGLHRKAFKVGDFLAQYQKYLELLANPKEDLKKTLNLLLSAVMGVFLVFDNLVWLTTLKVLKLEKDSLKLKAYRFRLFACIIQTSIGVMDMQAAQQKTLKATPGTDEHTKAQEAEGAKAIDMVKNVFDFVTYANSAELFKNLLGFSLKDDVSGIAGAISSVAAMFALWTK